MTSEPPSDRFSTKKHKKTAVTFNAEKRKEYLSGFRKRKDIRRKKAVEEAKKESREAKRESRKQKKEQVEAINEQYEQIKAIQSMPKF